MFIVAYVTLKFDTYYITSRNYFFPIVIENIKIFPIINQVSFEWASMNQHPPVHQLAIYIHGMGFNFSSSFNEFNLDIHPTFWPSYSIDLAILLT
jgi:hypothetical protein